MQLLPTYYKPSDGIPIVRNVWFVHNGHDVYLNSLLKCVCKYSDSPTELHTWVLKHDYIRVPK